MLVNKIVGASDFFRDTMFKTTVRYILLALLTIFVGLDTYAQTITIGTIDPGPYAPGSTIAVPFHVDDTGGCIGKDNTYQLYISDALGSFAASTTPVATSAPNTFYATFLNYILPAGLTPGNYKFMVKATRPTPGVSSIASAAVVVAVGTPVTAGVTSFSTIGTGNETFGQCNNPANQYTFSDGSAAAAVTSTASFFNESTQTPEVIDQDIKTDYTFTAAHTNYTIIAKSVSATGTVSTKAYTLINNPITSSIRVVGNSTVCISPGSGGTASLTYEIDPASIQSNYPGNLYTISWGDGATTVLTFCDIRALNGLVTHPYTRASCGNPLPNQNNKFEVDVDISNTYCGPVGNRVVTYAAILKTPINTIQGPANVCTGPQQVIFNNLSAPGPDPNSTSLLCTDNPNARYIWLVNGVVKAAGYKQTDQFKYAFPTHGTYTITLREQVGNGYCPAADGVFTVCVQDPPTASFTIPATPVCISAPVTPTNTTNPDVICNAGYTYIWTVDKNTYTFGGGTTLNSVQPQFNFTAAGTYNLTLQVTAPGGCTNTSQPQQIVIAPTPTATLAADLFLCGKGQTINFDNTRVTFTGASSTEGSLFLWEVAGGGGYHFVNSTTANSEYPQILFDDFGVYHVKVTRSNACGDAIGTQDITFQNAPTVDAGTVPAIICQAPTAGTPTVVHLNGTVKNGTVTSPIWTTSGSGTFSPATSLVTDYTPSNQDYLNGSVVLTLSGSTGLSGACATVTSSITLNLTKRTTITSATSNSICSGNNVGYTMTANNPGSSFTWTGTVTSGSASGVTASGTVALINDQLVNLTPTIDAVIKYTITPTNANGCPGDPFDFTVTVPSVPVVTFTPPLAICSNSPAGINFTSSPGTRYTWRVSLPAGVTGGRDQAAFTNNNTITDRLVNNNPTTATVVYTVTPYNSNSTCPGAAVSISVDVYPAPVTSVAGQNQSLCGQTSYVLQGNSPGTGTGKWTVVSGTGLTFADDTSPTTTVSGLAYGSTYTLKWTITSPNGCTSESSINISVTAATVGGITSGADTVCAGNNSGNITLTGRVGNVLRWERSTNSGVNWQTVPGGNIADTQSYLNLTQTTQYRAIVLNGSCNIDSSTVTIITVNPPAVIATAGVNQILCNFNTTTLNGNDPGIFVGIWTQTNGPSVTITDIHNPKTTITGLTGANTYTFRWTITGLPPCADSFADVTITNNADVVASFTTSPKTGCGNLTVNFTNTSNNQPSAVFKWNFGDGSTSNTASPQHIFAQRTDGRDTTYYISLAVISNCVQRPAIIDSVLVRPATPIARILPVSTNGCGNFAINVQNTSPGNNVSYDFYLYDGNILVQTITKTDKTNAIFNPISTTVRKTFTVYMIATGYCGTTNESTHVPIVISPSDVVAQMFIQNDVHAGCAPLNATFVNNSYGGNNFYYTVYDANNNVVDKPVASTASLPYTFTKAGTYFITITAINSCGMNESPRTRVDVFPVPTPSFVADVTTACKNLRVTFTNNTVSNEPNTPATSLVYDWDFGDGTTHSVLFAPVHSYAKSGTFTVTLTATNTASGCSDVFTRQSYIVINAPPSTAFSAQPDSIISIPNYTMSFVDKTKGNPITWKWQFSDGQVSNKQNPIVTFADTGIYKVTLTTNNTIGCDSALTKTVRIDGVPGQLYLPNAFMPNSATNDLRVFRAKGSGIKQWHLQIFNIYGQLLWETTKLTTKGEPMEAWDGTFNGTPMPQGVYQWQASATFINGNEWKGNAYGTELPKRVGSIHLIK
ncbi:MAG: PKD domain-containing protein [Mucilaginibacter sp.]